MFLKENLGKSKLWWLLQQRWNTSYTSHFHALQSKFSITRDNRTGWWFRRQKSRWVCGARMQEKKAAPEEEELNGLCGIHLWRACGLLAIRCVPQIRVMFYVGINRIHFLQHQWNCAIFVMPLKLRRPWLSERLTIGRRWILQKEKATKLLSIMGSV